jgi:hypothetical protein
MGVPAKPFESQNSKRETWEFEHDTSKGAVPAESDLAAHGKNRIVMVVMRADENDYDGIQTFRKRAAEFPAWPPAATANAPR